MTNRPNLSEEEKEHYNKVAMDKILESISEHIQDIIGDAYDLFAEEKITRQKYIDFLSLQAKMLNKEAEGHKEFMDKLDILKKMNTEESKEGVKRFFDNTKQNS